MLRVDLKSENDVEVRSFVHDMLELFDARRKPLKKPTKEGFKWLRKVSSYVISARVRLRSAHDVTRSVERARAARSRSARTVGVVRQ